MNLHIQGEIKGEPKEWHYNNVRGGDITPARNVDNADPSLLIFYADEKEETQRVYIPFDWIRNINITHD